LHATGHARTDLLLHAATPFGALADAFGGRGGAFSGAFATAVGLLHGAVAGFAGPFACLVGLLAYPLACLVGLVAHVLALAGVGFVGLGVHGLATGWSQCGRAVVRI